MSHSSKEIVAVGGREELYQSAPISSKNSTLDALYLPELYRDRFVACRNCLQPRSGSRYATRPGHFGHGIRRGTESNPGGHCLCQCPHQHVGRWRNPAGRSAVVMESGPS